MYHIFSVRSVKDERERDGAGTDVGAGAGVGAGTAVARGKRAGTWAGKNVRKGTRNARSFWLVDTQALLDTTLPSSMNISCTMKLLPTMQSFVRAMSYNRTILRPCPRSSGDRASASGAESHRFESCRGHHITPPACENGASSPSCAKKQHTAEHRAQRAREHNAPHHHYTPRIQKRLLHA